MAKKEKKQGFIRKKILALKEKLFTDNRVGLIHLNGIILDSGENPLTKRIVKCFEEAEEKELKAIVLRINSPGGSVVASQEIYAEIKRAREKGMIVVAAYGDVCASGGVYIASAADKMISNPGTITGSIGAIIPKNNLKALYEKIGIVSENIKSGPYKDFISRHRYLTEEEKSFLQDMVNDTYEQFVKVVADGRNMEVDEVKKYADGRIFSGAQALEYGMVDKVGSLKDAIDYAAELAGFEEEPEIVELKHKKNIALSLLTSKLDSFSVKTDYSGIPMLLMPHIL